MTDIYYWALGVVETIKYIDTHEKYTQNNPSYDVALITLDNPINVDGFMAPLCLWNPKDDDEVNGKRGRIVGWGKEDEDDVDEEHRVAKTLNMNMVNSDTCQKSAGFESLVTKTTFCAGMLAICVYLKINFELGFSICSYLNF